VARKKTPKVRVNAKASLARRLRQIRQELFGDHGGPELARRLNLPARTWYNYETGVTVPAEVLLSFIEQTGANPVWLLSGEGSVYRRNHEDAVLSELTAVELIRRGLERLEREPSNVMVAAPENLPHDVTSDFVAIPVVALRDVPRRVLETSQVERYIMAFRDWLPHPADTFAATLEDDAMHPILPRGSVVAVDRTVTDPLALQGRLVAACPEGKAMVRWLDVSGRHIILRPSLANREYPLIPVELSADHRNVIVGQVAWAWSRFAND
jgi:SOS-response transcriptional repressor LexA